MASILENSLNSIAACYKGKSGDKHILDKSVMNDEFKWVMAITQVSLAIKRGELTQEQFIERVTRQTAVNLPDLPIEDDFNWKGALTAITIIGIAASAFYALR